MTYWTEQLKTKGPYVLSLVTLGILIASAWVAYSAISTLINNETRVSQTKSIVRATTDTFSEMQSVELGFRAFLITGKERYLDPYRIARNRLRDKLSELSSYQSEDVAQRGRIVKLEQLIVTRLDDVDDVLNDINNLYEAKLVLQQELLNDDKKLQAIRQLVNDMVDTEYALLQDQVQEVKTAREQVWIATSIAIVIALTALFTSSLLFYSTLKKREEEKVRLEVMVSQRTSELQHLLNELERSNQDLQDFAFVASHDLQEPLRKIRAFSDRLTSKYGQVLGDGKDYLDRMNSAATRMSRLIEDLLEFSRVSTRAQAFKPVDLNDILKDVLETLELSIEDSKASIAIATLPVIEADSVQLKQLFQNIIGNALKFTAPGRQPDIHIGCTNISPVDHPLLKEETWYEVFVTDNGIGFEEKYLDRIFTPFKRLHGKSAYAGTGIGLAVCKKIVERHGGEITANSVPDVGTTFRIRLPASQSSESELEVRSIQPTEMNK